MFQNLYFALDERFRDHNFSHFLGQIHQVPQSQLVADLEESWRPVREERSDLNWRSNVFEVTLSSKTCDSFFRKYGELPVDKRDYYLSKLGQFVWLTISTWHRHVGYQRWGKELDLQERMDEALAAIPQEFLPNLAEFNFWGLHRSLRNGDSTRPEDVAIEVFQVLQRFLPGGDLAKQSAEIAGPERDSDRAEARKETADERKARIDDFRRKYQCKAMGIYRRARVDKADFYRWLRLELPDCSAMAQAIENSLKEIAQIKAGGRFSK